MAVQALIRTSGGRWCDYGSRYATVSGCSGRPGGDRTEADNDEADEARDADGVRPTGVCDAEQTGAAITQAIATRAKKRESVRCVILKRGELTSAEAARDGEA